MSEHMQNPFQVKDLVLDTMPEDDRLWVPQTDTVSFRPILFNVSNGYWINLLKVTRAGILNRHLHPAPVFGYVIKGSWRYLEHDWVAKEGSFVYEPPGEVHTLVVDEDVEEMITLFHVQGTLIYMDENNNTVGFDNVHTKMAMCEKHFEKVGLGRDYVKQFVR
ncbi:MAG: 2,4'-dihydroxyacetophenone dioxygenase family protein [Verrucomicrobia bacterium]|nr:2,4'-dihydroxyacetophenone dioxygenase family protein [Verrucomicrobiota bacterium]MDA1069445.1 2,4'-dihydroxyacetophenone dioxygenase family protein [Verrucomicrobiota bacterium]